MTAGAPELPVLASIEGRVGRLTLNRSKALHALNHEMCTIMVETLLAWRANEVVQIVQIDHAGDRGFCAGGDIRMLAESGAADGAVARAFFRLEYQLNALLQGYGKPVIALMDGVTMGGGVGISVHGAYRVATERTVFAMPETGIGLFPDVGGGWFLPRLPLKELGTWLALTGARLKGDETVTAGIATHYIPTELLGAARAQIAGAAETHRPRAALKSGLDALCEAQGKSVPADLDAIARLFSHSTVEAILDALRRDGSAWALAQIDTLNTKSPQTLKVALRQLREGAALLSFAENMRNEFRIGSRVVARHDFLEGVRAVIVDKDNAPRWDPPTLSEVSAAMLDEIFALLPVNEEWQPLDAG